MEQEEPLLQEIADLKDTVENLEQRLHSCEQRLLIHWNLIKEAMTVTWLK
tara:strand:- start:4142 stop:4291 length:150 start_codon:yes stop_codon:yes gene_type:complete